MESTNLLIGDVVISNPEASFSIFFERKTIADLFSSLQDGRYHEQSMRLLSSAQPIVYILEGNCSQEQRTMFHYTVQSILFSKGFQAVSTRNVQDTAQFLFHLVQKWDKKRLEKKPFHFSQQKDGDVQKVQSMYVDTLKTAKKENVTRDNIASIMLCQIPGVSAKLASFLLDTYEQGDLLQFLQIVRTTPEVLHTYRHCNGNKLGKHVIHALQRFFADDDANVDAVQKVSKEDVSKMPAKKKARKTNECLLQLDSENML